jgi:hypothetical protein
MATVINIKKTKDKDFVYIGRKNIKYGFFYNSKWSNPFVIGINGNRQECLKQYADLLLRRVMVDDNFKKELMSLDNKVLGCWCKPDDCHGDVIVELIELLKGQNNG